jgi:hypothetical protein
MEHQAEDHVEGPHVKDRFDEPPKETRIVTGGFGLEFGIGFKKDQFQKVRHENALVLILFLVFEIV